MMNWGKFVIVCVLLALAFAAEHQLTVQAQKPESCEIQILVMEHKDVEVTVPCIARQDVIDVLSTFFAKGDDQAKKKIGKVLTDGGDVTLRITSKAKP